MLAGYFAITPVSDLNFVNLTMLMISSGLLYVSGVIFNDYFDIEIDRKERPSRPLVSGKVSKRNAMKIGLISMISAAILSFFVSWSSFAIAIFLSSAIFAYDYKLKHNRILGPISMGGSRFLNVLLGSSPLLQLPINVNLGKPFFVAIILFVYVVVIILFSKKEISGMNSKKQTVILFSIVYFIIATIGIAIVLGVFKTWSIVILVCFVVIISLIFKQIIVRDATSIQKGIKNMIISIIILDSIFVSGTAGLLYGLPTLLFLLPTVLLSRKFYVT